MLVLVMRYYVSPSYVLVMLVLVMRGCRETAYEDSGLHKSSNLRAHRDF